MLAVRDRRKGLFARFALQRLRVQPHRRGRSVDAGNGGRSRLARAVAGCACETVRLYAALPAAFAHAFQPVSGALFAS